jgi:hypothetical protein
MMTPLIPSLWLAIHNNHIYLQSLSVDAAYSLWFTQYHEEQHTNDNILINGTHLFQSCSKLNVFVYEIVAWGKRLNPCN